MHHLDPSKAIQAPYSQGDVVVIRQSAGQQCVAMSLCALIYHNMKEESLWLKTNNAYWKSTI